MKTEKVIRVSVLQTLIEDKKDTYKEWLEKGIVHQREYYELIVCLDSLGSLIELLSEKAETTTQNREILND
jgi:hypothetical protein